MNKIDNYAIAVNLEHAARAFERIAYPKHDGLAQDYACAAQYDAGEFCGPSFAADYDEIEDAAVALVAQRFDVADHALRCKIEERRHEFRFEPAYRAQCAN